MAEENIKIYKAEDAGQNPVLTEGERAAREFMTQQQNGNLQKGHELGAAMTDLFLAAEVSGAFTAQKWALLSYLTETLIEENIHPAVLAQSVEAKFAELLEERSPAVARAIHDPRAITLYSLNENKPRSRSEGEVFARLCKKPEDEALIAEGEALARDFTEAVKALIQKTAFVH